MEIENLYKELSCRIDLLSKSIVDSFESKKLDRGELLRLQEQLLDLGHDISLRLCSSLSSLSKDGTQDFGCSEENMETSSNDNDITDEERLFNTLDELSYSDKSEYVIDQGEEDNDTSGATSRGYKIVDHTHRDLSHSTINHQEQSDSDDLSLAEPVSKEVNQANLQPFVLRKLLPIVDYYAVLKMCFHNREDLVSDFEDQVGCCETLLDAEKYIMDIFELEEEDETMKIFLKALQKYYM
ncbi:hypothetical protein [Falsiporphyromonas endometrii]|uniref:Uncharacterized protein n=1 Tax=Falsiporphyromonas endometrii TaxID=1387297 RepID=A0ABV9K7R3_9PORP